MSRVDQQALLIICGGLYEVGSGLLALIGAFKRSAFILINLSKQFVGLIFFRMLLDHLLKQFDCLGSLIGEHKSGREFFLGAGVVRANFENPKIEWQRPLDLA